MIPFLDLSAVTAEIREELDAAYHRFMDSGWYVLGAEVDAFETAYAEFCEAKHCVGVGTGLDAITLALKALGIGRGDEVIVPSNTYIATWLAVTHLGATIVPVEPNIETFNIDIAKIEPAISSKTKCILPVNLYGQPVDYDPIVDIAKSVGASVVIDNAQSQGARYKGRKVGGLADIECHSFYPSKNLGALGEAGAITTNSEQLAQKIKTLRNYGSQKRYYNKVIGTNSRIDAIQAAFLSVKLRHLDRWNERRKSIAATYNDAFQNASLTTPTVPSWADPVWHLYVIKSDRRDQFQQFLTDNKIGNQIHYPIPPHKSEAYQHLASSWSLPIAVDLADQVLSIPIDPFLDQSAVNTVISKTLDFENV